MIYLIIKSYFTILLSIGMTSIGAFIIGLYFILKKTSSSPNLSSLEKNREEILTDYLITDQPPVESTPIACPVMSLNGVGCEADGISRTEPELLHDLSAIAGDDVIVTQLDLARAFIEADKKLLAKQILESAVAQGSVAQQKEAQHLLNTL